jgi:hypothetical protein
MVQENNQVLLRDYARVQCEASFSELVHRHPDTNDAEDLWARGQTIGSPNVPLAAQGASAEPTLAISAIVLWLFSAFPKRRF